jgi:hypothetical protein
MVIPPRTMLVPGAAGPPSVVDGRFRHFFGPQGGCHGGEDALGGPVQDSLELCLLFSIEGLPELHCAAIGEVEGPSHFGRILRDETDYAISLKERCPVKADGIKRQDWLRHNRLLLFFIILAAQAI